MKVLAFDIWGDFGHFRKFYTTSSPLTFSFPPPPTIAGILGAIYGASKSYYLDIFSYELCRVALRIIQPIKKVRYSINLINTKDNYWTPISRGRHEPRTRIRTEFIKTPYYRIYVLHQDTAVLKKLKEMLEQHKTVYTLSLGLSELLADFRFHKIYDAIPEESKDFVPIYSVLPVSMIVNNGLKIDIGMQIFKEKIPIRMNTQRVIQNYSDVIFEVKGQPILCRVKEGYRINENEWITLL